ncbi:hypothetical protein EVAR_35562_1 [Eumeta japonica]|uniref:Uncharacterized protein n=1 Tax=Eumeta variegata TaxID=151549 RepID=A0A4C1XM04_EUMVA|nr:hypothetical protein EVAR_35562_1 [Eumeta japonica]
MKARIAIWSVTEIKIRKGTRTRVRSRTIVQNKRWRNTSHVHAGEAASVKLHKFFYTKIDIGIDAGSPILRPSHDLFRHEVFGSDAARHAVKTILTFPRRTGPYTHMFRGSAGRSC